MSIQLKLDELQEALSRADHPQASAFEVALCLLGDCMAAALAAALNVEAGETTQQGAAFAGICTPMRPRFRFQPIPAALDGFDADTAEEWEEDAESEELPPLPVHLIRPLIAALEADRDAYVSGAPDGSETPDPEGWRRDYPEDAERLDALEEIAAGMPDAPALNNVGVEAIADNLAAVIDAISNSDMPTETRMLLLDALA